MSYKSRFENGDTQSQIRKPRSNFWPTLASVIGIHILVCSALLVSQGCGERETSQAGPPQQATNEVQALLQQYTTTPPPPPMCRFLLPPTHLLYRRLLPRLILRSYSERQERLLPCRLEKLRLRLPQELLPNRSRIPILSSLRQRFPWERPMFLPRSKPNM